MDVFLLALAVAYMVGSKFQSDTSKAAYKAGKEPPGLQKARMRHEGGGGRRKPGSGKPAGPGAARLMLSSRWANACEKAKDRADDKHRRWRAWHSDQAPHRDEQWRAKQARRIAKSEARAEKFAAARGIARHAVNPRARAENHAWEENARRDTAHVDPAGATPGTPETEATSPEDTEATHAPDTTEGDTTEAAPHTPDSGAQHLPTFDTRTSGSTAPAATEGATVYQQAVDQLIAAADRVAEYRGDLTHFGDDLAGYGWGEQVTGPISDMDSQLSELEGLYRDLATQMQHQGDQGSAAYEQAPWVPGPHAVLS